MTTTKLGDYDIGDEVIITALFTDAVTGAAADPTALTWRILHPDTGTQVVDDYTEASPEVDNPTVGTWTLTFTITAADFIPGAYWSRPAGTATIVAADEAWFRVKRSSFATP